MKILVINWRCIKNPEAGGAEVHLHEIFSRIVKLGHDVTLVVHKFTDASDTETIDGIKIIRVGNRYLFHKQFKKFYLSKLKQQDFDIVVDDISKIPLNTPSYIKKPVAAIIHHLHGKTLFDEVFFPAAYYIYKRELRIPQNYYNTPIFTVSQSTKNELIEIGYPEEKIDILYNAITQENFESSFPEKNSKPRLIYIGRIKKYKKLETIIDAMPKVIKEFPEATLTIGGMGSHLDNLKLYIEEKKLTSNIKVVGKVSEEEKAELLRNSWIFITMASKEGWGITVIEANAAFTPVIGSDVPGLRDSIVNGETGLLSPVDSPSKLAENIRKLLSNKEKLHNMQLNAKKWADKFTWENSANHFLNKIYEWYPELKGR